MLAVLLAGCGRKGDLYLPRDARRPREAGEEEPSPDDIVPEDYDDR
jgi:predicted small lipoprotein YifL